MKSIKSTKVNKANEIKSAKSCAQILPGIYFFIPVIEGTRTKLAIF